MTQAEIDLKLNKARESFNRWKDMSYEKRGALFIRVAKDLRKNKQQYAELITREMGKPITQALAEIDKCAFVCEYYAENTQTFLQLEQVNADYTTSYVRFDPLGLILAVMPWNFPFWQVFRAAVPTMMAGNGLVLKHASNVPQTALCIEQMFTDNGFPEGLFTTILIEGAKTESLIADKRIAAVTLTGSEVAGKEVAKTAGFHLKKTVLELGGSDPFIVLEDANLDEAVMAGVQARLLNAGQSCICAKRFILLQPIAEEFIRKFKQKLTEINIGDPLDPTTQLGPMVSEKALQTLHEQVELSKRSGAQVEYGGMELDWTGCYYSPTVITHVKRESIAYTEEFFGPVAIMLIAKDEEEAIALANDTKYGLGASIWTKNITKAEELAVQIEAGCVFINDIVKSDPRLPFGGIKISGYGRELGMYGIKEFVNIKTVVCK